MHTWGADNDSKFPPATSYGGSIPRRAVHGSGDYFGVLVPGYLEPREVWYCSEGTLFPDSAWNTGTRYATVNTLWDFADHQLSNVCFTENIFVNLAEKGGCTDIPRLLSNPDDWVVVNDGTYFNLGIDLHTAGTYPGRFSSWGLGGVPRGRNGPGALRRINAGTQDGAVTWMPRGKTMLGYPGSGGPSNYGCRLVQPSRPGRSGYLPY